MADKTGNSIHPPSIQEENISPVDQEDDDAVAYEYDDDDGRLIDIPFLSNYPFEFDQFVNSQGLSYGEVDREKWINVTETHVPKDSSIGIEHADARCKFLGIESNEDNIKEQRKELKMHRNIFKKAVHDFLERYFLLLSKHLGILFYDKNKPIENWSHITAAYCQVKSREEAEKFLVLLYLSFDFIENYREKLTKAALRQIGIRVVKPPALAKANPNKPRKKINVFESIATVIINLYRKSLNRYGPKTCGWTLTSVRPGYVFNEHNENEYREDKTIYQWMINGKQV